MPSMKRAKEGADDTSSISEEEKSMLSTEHYQMYIYADGRRRSKHHRCSASASDPTMFQ